MVIKTLHEPFENINAWLATAVRDAMHTLVK